MPAKVPLPLSAKWEAIWAPAAEKYGVIGEAHLLLQILEAPDDMTAALLLASGVSREEAQLYAQSWLEHEPPSAAQKLEFSRGVSQILRLASDEAKREGSPFIEPHHFLIACVLPRRGPHLGEVLRPLGLDAAPLRRHLRRIRLNQREYPRGNPLNDLSADAKAVIESAQAEMRASFCGRIGAAHLLLALLRDGKLADTLQHAGINVEDLRGRAKSSIRSDGEVASPQKRFSPGAKRAIERAARIVRATNRQRIGREKLLLYIGCEQLLLGLLPQRETFGERWRADGRNLDSVEALWTAEDARVDSRGVGRRIFSKSTRSGDATQTKRANYLVDLCVQFCNQFCLGRSRQRSVFAKRIVLVFACKHNRHRCSICCGNNKSCGQLF